MNMILIYLVMHVKQALTGGTQMSLQLLGFSELATFHIFHQQTSAIKADELNELLVEDAGHHS
jgi:hypothetical protein